MMIEENKSEKPTTVNTAAELTQLTDSFNKTEDSEWITTDLI